MASGLTPETQVQSRSVLREGGRLERGKLRRGLVSEPELGIIVEVRTG